MPPRPKRSRLRLAQVLIALGSVALRGAVVGAQPQSSAMLTGTACPGVGCVVVGVGGLGSAGIQVTGTWVGTLTFEVSLDGVNYVAASALPVASTTTVTTTTGNGVWTITTAGVGQLRLRFSAYTSGTATTTVITSPVAAGPSAHGGGGGGGGSIGGSIAATQVAFGTASNTIGGSNNLTYDSDGTNPHLFFATDPTLGDGSSGLLLGLDQSALELIAAFNGGPIVAGSSSETALTIASAGSLPSYLNIQQAGGTLSAPTATLANANLGHITFEGLNGPSWNDIVNIVDITAVALSNNGATAKLTISVTSNGWGFDGSNGTTTIPGILAFSSAGAAASLMMSGNFAATLTFTGATNVTFPTSGALISSAGGGAPTSAMSGTRFLCISTTGVVTSSATACSGT